MFDALRQSLGKREGQRLILIGTRSPAEPGSWWPALLDGGSGPGTHVEVLAAPDDAPWDNWHTIRRVNPLAMVNPALRKNDSPGARRSEARGRVESPPELRGVPIEQIAPAVAGDALRSVGMASGRAARGSAPCGSPVPWPRPRIVAQLVRSVGHISERALRVLGSLSRVFRGWRTRERQDAQPRFLYRRLAEQGALIVDEGLRVSRPETLIAHLLAVGIDPEVVICDRFMLPQLSRTRSRGAGRYMPIA